MEKQELSITKQTFLVHLKDLISVYIPSLQNEFSNFEKVIKSGDVKNYLIIRQTIQYFIKKLKQNIPQKQIFLLKIIKIWTIQFKDKFPEDKDILYLTLMYLFFQIDSSIDFLVETGKLDKSNKKEEQEEKKKDCMKKLSLLTGIIVNYDEYNAFMESCLESLSNENKKKNQKKKKGNLNEKKNQLEELIEKDENNKEEECNKDEKYLISYNQQLSVEEKLSILENKIKRIDELENQMKTMKKEISFLKNETAYLRNKCGIYEINKIIKRFFKHVCICLKIPYNSYHFLNLPQLIYEQNNSNIEEKKQLEKLLEIYYSNEINISNDLQEQNLQNSDLDSFLSQFQILFSKYNFNYKQSDLLQLRCLINK